jgi:hypothetical protein
MSNALRAITHRVKMMITTGYVAYVSMWDARMNEIFTKMHLVITYEKYLIWYIIITYHVITLGLEEVPPPGYMQYKQHV